MIGDLEQGFLTYDRVLGKNGINVVIRELNNARIQRSRRRLWEMAAAIDPVECVVAAGSLVVMRPLIIHASSKSRNDLPRRVIHIEYAASQRLAGMELALS